MPGKMLNILRKPPDATDEELKTAFNHYKELRKLLDFGNNPSEKFIKYKMKELKEKIKVLRGMDDAQTNNLIKNILAQCDFFCEKLELEQERRAQREQKKLA